MIIDGMMHLEANGEYWDGLFEEVIECYDAAGIDKGVVLATWMPSRESNDLTLAACKKYPDRFIPFGHVRPVDEWESELKRGAIQVVGNLQAAMARQGRRSGGGVERTAARRVRIASAAAAPQCIPTWSSRLPTTCLQAASITPLPIW